MKNFTKKIVTLTLGSAMALGMCFGATACKKERGLNDILMWAGGQWTGSDADNLMAFIDWYNETNELGVTIDLVIQEDFETTFATANASNDTPDILIWDRFNTPSYAFAETLEPLDELIASYEIDKTRYNETAYNELSYEGKQYGLPLDLDLWGIYVNMEIVKAYNEQNPNNQITCFWGEDGVTPRYDWTWEECLDTAQKLKGTVHTNGVENGSKVTAYSGYDGTNVQEFFIHNLFSTGEEFLNDRNRAEIDPAIGADLLTYLHELYETGKDGYGNTDGFLTGKLAMYMRPTYFTSYLDRYAKIEDYRFMPQPAYSKLEANAAPIGKNRGVMGGYGMAIPRPVSAKDRTAKWAAKRDRCFEFMQDVLYSDANMRKWAEISKTIPALLSTHESDEVKNNKLLGPVIDYTTKYTVRPAVPGWTYVQVGVFNDCIKNYVKDANALTEGTITATLNRIVRETNEQLGSY